MRRYFLSKKERKRFLAMLRERFGLELESDKIEIVDDGVEKYYLIDGSPAFVSLGEKIIPLLKWLLKNGHCFLPKIIVDQGAIKPVSSGANLMAPGIIGIQGDFQVNDIAVVIDERHAAPLAIVEALYSAEEIRGMKKGKVAINIHHVGDKYWKIDF